MTEIAGAQINRMKILLFTLFFALAASVQAQTVPDPALVRYNNNSRLTVKEVSSERRGEPREQVEIRDSCSPGKRKLLFPLRNRPQPVRGKG